MELYRLRGTSYDSTCEPVKIQKFHSSWVELLSLLSLLSIRRVLLLLWFPLLQSLLKKVVYCNIALSLLLKTSVIIWIQLQYANRWFKLNYIRKLLKIVGFGVISWNKKQFIISYLIKTLLVKMTSVEIQKNLFARFFEPLKRYGNLFHFDCFLHLQMKSRRRKICIIPGSLKHYSDPIS